MTSLPQLLIIIGISITLIGIILYLIPNLPISKLSGDFIYKGKNITIYFPLITSIIISILITIILVI